jgi:hypothetical protein
MEIIDLPIGEEPVAEAPWGEPPPPKLEEQELDLIAFELWQRGCCWSPATEDAGSEEIEEVACHASCL